MDTLFVSFVCHVFCKIKSIIKHFWENFKRIKIGIWFNDKFEVSDWVLSKFSEEEIIDLNNDVFKNTNILLTQNF